ncbi:MAG: bifunctional adenosylcobinamide kinase/adenosylcobinamide-phosphate guanylyltransferase [Acidimicrobiales bacterium]
MITLVLGGARSGKSAVAERLVGANPVLPVTYLATAAAGTDDDLDRRIAAHRARRPLWWTTVEADPDSLVGVLRATRGIVLLDALGPWVAGAPGFAVDVEGFCDALVGRAGDTVVVAEEVGLGVHPATEEGRRFRDALGALNQAVSAVADTAMLVVAGRVLRLDPGPP